MGKLAQFFRRRARYARMVRLSAAYSPPLTYRQRLALAVHRAEPKGASKHYPRVGAKLPVWPTMDAATRERNRYRNAVALYGYASVLRASVRHAPAWSQHWPVPRGK